MYTYNKLYDTIYVTFSVTYRYNKLIYLICEHFGEEKKYLKRSIGLENPPRDISYNSDLACEFVYTYCYFFQIFPFILTLVVCCNLCVHSRQNMARSVLSRVRDKQCKRSIRIIIIYGISNVHNNIYVYIHPVSRRRVIIYTTYYMEARAVQTTGMVTCLFLFWRDPHSQCTLQHTPQD